ncbi:hypothetical protein ACSBR1_021720 [Camellia fascicularis]
MVTKKDEKRGQGSLQEENREPLLQDQEKTSAVRKDRHEWMVYFSTFVASCGSYSLGTCVGYSSPVQSAITEDLNLSIAEYSLFGSILTFGAMAGAFTSEPTADFIGRKGAMRTSSAFCVAGWLAIYFAKGSLALDIGRVATGYGMGVFSYVVPVFIAEIAPKNLRGALATPNQLMIVCGVSVSFIIGTVLSWRALALTGEIVNTYQNMHSVSAKVGQRKEFEAALQKLRGKDADTSQEQLKSKFDYIETLQQFPKDKLLDLFQTRYLCSVIIAVGLMVCQQLGGINGVCFYNTSIFESAGSYYRTRCNLNRQSWKKTPDTGSVLTAIAFYLKTYEIAPEASPIFAVTGILVYIGSFSIGMGAVPWIIMSEVCTFILYGAVNAIAIVFVVKVVPETKGRTLEQIQAAING